MFTTVGSTKVLKCTVSQQSTFYTWENGKTIAQQEKINTKIQHLNKFSINRTLQEYNLKINNISTADGGKYCCEQISVQYCIQLCIKGNHIIDFFLLFRLRKICPFAGREFFNSSNFCFLAGVFIFCFGWVDEEREGEREITFKFIVKSFREFLRMLEAFYLFVSCCRYDIHKPYISLYLWFIII